MEETNTSNTNNKKNPIKKNKKIAILSLLILIVVIALIIVLLPKGNDTKNEKTDNGIYAHTEKGIVEEENFEGIKYSNISMLTKEGYTTFSANVTNVSDKDITNEMYHISLKNTQGKEVVKLLVHIPNGLKKGETKTITATALGEFKDVVTKDIIK